MIKCPNINHPDWLSLVNKVGVDEAYFLWNAYDGIVPADVIKSRQKTITELRKEIGVPHQINASNRANIKKKVADYNTRNNTAHGVTFEQIGESQRLRTNLTVNYSPYNAQARQERAEMRSEEGKVFTEQIETNLKEVNKIQPADSMEQAKAQLLRDFNNYFPQFSDLTTQERISFIDMMSEGEINIYC